MTFSKLDHACFLVILASGLLIFGTGWDWPVYAAVAAAVPPCFTVFKNFSNFIRVVVRG